MKATFGKRLFPLGQIVATPGALRALEHSGEDASAYLDQHVTGQWGNLNQNDSELNKESLMTGGRIMSVYSLRSGEVVWILTEADRASTCVLLPEDY